MCLPSIINVAEDAGVELNPRTIGKKEVYAKCPFCLGDSTIKGKYKLSLNQQYNVFKCWLCGEHGGVLEFESKLTGSTFDEVRAKYFGQKKNYHPAEKLSPMQLKQIGWQSAKRSNPDSFKKKRDAVLHDWKAYEQSEMIKHFALLMVIAHLDDQEERQKELLTFLAQSCQRTGINFLFSRIFEEYVKDDSERSEWTKESIRIARVAWLTSRKSYDFDMVQVVMNVLFFNHLEKKSNQINAHLNQKRA